MKNRMRLLCVLIVGTWALAGAATAALAGTPCANVFDGWPMSPTNTPTSAVGLGHFNEDDVPDAAVQGSAVLSVLLGNGDGTFQTVETALSQPASDFVVGDFNGDQADDVAVVFGPSGAVLIGNGDGTFGPELPFTTSGFIFNLGVGYADADPFLDLMVGGVGLSVLLGHGNGTFALPIDYSTAGILNSIAVADLDGDGHVDIATTSQQSNSVEIRPGSGDGTFGAPITVPAGLDLSGLRTAQLREGTDPDLIAISDGLVAVVLALGDFEYQAALVYETVGEAEGVAAADIDGDGHPDLLVSSSVGPSTETVLVVLGNAGDGTFIIGSSYPILSNPTAPAADDLDGDGRPDALVASIAAKNLVALRNTGDGNFSGPRFFDVEGGSTLAAGDFDEDGILDLVLGGIYIALGKPGAEFETAPVQPEPAGVGAAAVADVDGDGHLDVVGAGQSFSMSNYLVVYAGHGDGTFEPPVTFASPGNVQLVSGLVLADFDGDTKLDAAYSTVDNSGNGQVSVFLGDGAGNFTPSAFMATASALYGGLVVGDFDSDGFRDLATVGFELFFDSTLSVFLGRGDGTFDLPVTTALTGHASALTAGEFVQAGIVDLVFGLGVSIVRMNGNDDGTFDDPVAIVPVDPETLAAADFDGDGVLDLMAGTHEFQAFAKGLGAGTYAEPILFPVPQSSGRLLAADFDGNGAPDSVSTFGSIGVAVVRNARLGASVRDTSAIVGTPGRLVALAGGTSPLSYQWRKDGEPLTDGGTISGAQTATLVIDPVSFDDAGSYDVVVTDACGEVTSNAATLSVEFADVALSSPFHDDILIIAAAGITGGCGGGNYCPTSPVRRDQMAVFLLKSEHGADYTPPPCTGVFDDVSCPGPFTDWVEQLAAEGVTGGCGGDNYCPSQSVTRTQMAVFLLKTKEGSGYTPPPATGIFGDVPVGSFAADFIEDLYNRGITGGCSASPLLYCPGNAVLRQQMATFLVRTFIP